MAFNQNIPQATDRIRDSQLALLNNFIELNTAFDINHVSFNDANHGKHNFVSMPEQGAAPVTAVDEAALYSMVGAASGVTELAWRRENNGAVIAMTEGSANVNGWTRLPSGIMLKWGVFATTPAGYTSYAPAGPNFAVVYCATASIYHNNTPTMYVNKIANVTNLALGSIGVFTSLADGTTPIASQVSYLITGI